MKDAELFVLTEQAEINVCSAGCVVTVCCNNVCSFTEQDFW